jgi:hypothetical protein
MLRKQPVSRAEVLQTIQEYNEKFGYKKKLHLWLFLWLKEDISSYKLTQKEVAFMTELLQK